MIFTKARNVPPSPSPTSSPSSTSIVFHSLIALRSNNHNENGVNNGSRNYGGGGAASPSPAYSSSWAFVPFSWEEKPGVPKQQEALVDLHHHYHQKYNHSQGSILNPSHGKLVRFRSANYLQTTTHEEDECGDDEADAKVHNLLPLRKPPALLHSNGTATHSALAKQNKKHHKSSARNRPHHRSYSTTSEAPSATVSVENDPFMMAIQACRKKNEGSGFYGSKPIKVFYEAPSQQQQLQRMQMQNHDSGHVQVRHLTIRQLFEEEHEELLSKNCSMKKKMNKRNKKLALAAAKPSPLKLLVTCLGF